MSRLVGELHLKCLAESFYFLLQKYEVLKVDQVSLKGSQVLGLRYDLLGAKLNSLLNALRIGQTYDLRSRAFWALTGPGARGRWAKDLSRPDEIFSGEFISRYLLTNPPIISDIESKFAYAQKEGPFKSASQLADVIARDGIIAVQERMEVITFPWEDPLKCKDDFALLFTNAVNLSKKAYSEIDRFHSTLSLFSGRPVGVHVRRGDIIRHPVTLRGAWRGMYQPDEVIFATLKRLSEKGNQAIIFCNDEEFVSRATNKFNGLIVKNEKVQDNIETNILIDFMDIYKMSACEYIIGSGVSAFSAVARNIGNSELIRFDNALSSQELNLACEDATLRVLSSDSTFLCEGDMLQTINFLLGYYLDTNNAHCFSQLTAVSKVRGLDISPYIDSLSKHKNNAIIIDAYDGIKK